MSAAVTGLVWIPKGRAKKRPTRWEATDEELAELERQYGIEGDIDEEGMTMGGARMPGSDVDDIEMEMDADSSDDDGKNPEAEVAGAGGSSSTSGTGTSTTKKGKKKTDAQELGDATGKRAAEGQAASNSNDDEESDSDGESERHDQNAKYHLNAYSITTPQEHDQAFNDPLLGAEEQDSESDEEDNVIKETDNVFVATSCDDDQCALEVFIYDEAEGAMFVHHDISLNAYPLCVDTVNCGGLDLAGGKAKGQSGKTASSSSTSTYTNLAAVGQFDNNIDIWDLDVLEPMAPVLTLGGKKKKGHKAAVMCVNAHGSERHLLASGAADNVLKIWDLEKGSCVHSFGHHEDKVQCVKWHPTEESVLLSAGYDKKLALLDVRKSASSAVMMHLSADAEQACWNQDDANLCYVTTEDGKVFCYDARMIVKEGDACAPVWELQAFQKGACSGVAQRKDVLLVGGTEGVAKVFDLRDLTLNGGSNVNPIFEKPMAVGSIFAVAGPSCKSNSDSMFLVSGHTVALWDLASEKTLADRFGFVA
eukprot:g14445.t1